MTTPITGCGSCIMKIMYGPNCFCFTMKEAKNCPCRNCLVKCMCSKVCNERTAYSAAAYARSKGG